MRKINNKIGVVADQVLNDPDADVWQFLAVAAVAQLAQIGGLLSVIAEAMTEDAPPEEGEPK